MASAGAPTQLGPFIGGLNTKSDQSALADNELYVCENFEIDFDGSLRSRPAFLADQTVMPLTASGQGTLLGYYQLPSGVTYLIASDGNSTTLAYTGLTWTVITTSVSAVGICQFNGKLWLLSGVSTQKGGSWDGTTYTTDNNMPYGACIATYRGLLYIGAGLAHTNPGRLFYSKAITASDFWPVAQNFVEVGYGDGQGINGLLQVNNTLLVMRTSSLWSYAWSSTPAGASITPLNTSVGLDNPYAVATLEGVVYFTYELKAYTLLNGRVDQLNDRVPFVATTTANYNRPIAVSVLGFRVIFSFYDQMYVYSTDTFTWSTWVSPTYGGIGKLYQRIGFRDRYATAYAAPSTQVAVGGTRTWRLLSINEGVDVTLGENFQCTLVTKVFDYGVTHQYKRLFWWGVDALFRSSMSGTVVPVSFQSSVGWTQLRAKTWGSMLLNTWGQPDLAILSLTGTRAAVGTTPQRKFVKMPKSLRFRQAYFRVVFQTEGSSASAPVKVFGMTTFVRIGERVSKTIT